MQQCRNCGECGDGNYCSKCGQAYAIKKITLHTLLDDVFHFFTHLDKGFGYTLKQLVKAPGLMQRQYIEGERAKHQKPFSMFFICATILALVRYWIFTVLLKYYHTGNAAEANFFHEYLVLYQILLLPLTVLITFLMFYSSGYNYAETGVMTLYSTSAFFIILTAISLLKLIWKELDTSYVELPVLLIYNGITFINFYRSGKKWLVVLKSLIIFCAFFFAAQYIEDELIGRL